MLRKGQFDELSKNKRILRSWKNTAKEHLLITKNMTDAEYQDFMQMVDDLLLEEKTFVQESKHWWEKWGLNVKEQLAEANIGFQKFKGKITKGTAALAKGMGKLMSLVGWASILTMMYKTLMDGWNNLHRTVETFIDWGDSLSDFFGSKGLDGISKWLKNITDDARKNTKGWIDYKKELLETKKISDDITKASDNLNDSFGEFQSIARELSVDFDKLGPTSERFIKAMKLMQSLKKS